VTDFQAKKHLKGDLYRYFIKCINTKYLHTKEGGSYATERNGNTLYIFFEHSNGRADWISNVDFRIKRAEKKRGASIYHNGFLIVWNSILPYIKGQIADKSVRKIIIVGYSHGGAIAGLCFEYVKMNRRDIEVLEGYGYGAPRFKWGKRDALHIFKGHYVIRNKNDIVTYLPPRLFGFIHVGEIINIGEGSHYSPIDAHRKESYIKSLEAYKKPL
jgi:hypothetical protein